MNRRLIHASLTPATMDTVRDDLTITLTRVFAIRVSLDPIASYKSTCVRISLARITDFVCRVVFHIVVNAYLAILVKKHIVY